VSADTEAVGSIGVVRFDNPRALKREANNLYSADKAGTPDDGTRILQGMLEESNVNAVEELTRMIEVHRAYASNQRVLQDEHDRIRRAARVILGTNSA
jgi:flagellar basal-body rod protein FlgF